MANMIQHLIIDAEKTVGGKLLLLSVRPYASYKEGVKGEQEGLTFNCLSETMDYEKIPVCLIVNRTRKHYFRSIPVI